MMLLPCCATPPKQRTAGSCGSQDTGTLHHTVADSAHASGGAWLSAKPPGLRRPSDLLTTSLLVALAVLCYFLSFILRAPGWRRLFPLAQKPDQARCLASVGAAAASGAVLPFRLDYLVKIGTLRRLSGVRIGLEAIALSTLSLGMIDARTGWPDDMSPFCTHSALTLPRAQLGADELSAASYFFAFLAWRFSFSVF